MGGFPGGGIIRPSAPASAGGSTRVRPRPGDRISRDFRRLWWGLAVSSVGDRVFATTLVLWVSQQIAHGRSWAPVAVSGLLVATGAAAVLAGPVAGVLVDRWNRVTVMTLTEAARALLTAGLAALSFVPGRDLPAWAWLSVLYGAVLVLGACGQFFMLAQLAVVGDLVEGEAGRARAAAVIEVTVSAAAMVGPPVAAPLVLGFGPRWALAACAVSYLVSLVATRSLGSSVGAPPRAAARGGLRAEFAEGLRVFTRHRYVTALLTVTVVCQAGTAAVTALNVFFVTTSLHASASLYGTAEMVMGCGFIVGAAVAGCLVRRVGARAVTWSGLFAAGALTVIYALQRDAVAGLVVLGAYAAMISLLNTATAPILLGAAPREFRGRVLAVFGPVNQVVSSVWIVVWGWLASTVLRGFRAAPAGVPLDGVSLIFVIAGCLVIAAGFRALVALPPAPGQLRRGGAPAGAPVGAAAGAGVLSGAARPPV